LTLRQSHLVNPVERHLCIQRAVGKVLPSMEQWDVVQG